MYRSKMNSASKGNRPVASRVDSRKSTNIAAIWSSRPPETSRTLDDADFAGRATAAAAAHGRVRNPGPAACFQHGEAGWDGNDTMSRIGDAHCAEALSVPIARPAQAEHYDHQTEIGDGHAVGDPDH